MALSHKPLSGLPTLFITSFVLLTATNKVNSATKAVSFDFREFKGDENITLQDSAEIVDGILALTNHKDPVWKTGRALYSTPIPLWDVATGNVASFVASFSFIVDSYPGITRADGLVFFLAPNGSKIPPFSGAGQLGVVNNLYAFNRFVGVEFDTYSNEWDPRYPHIGIDVNSLISLKTRRWNRVDKSLVKVSIIYDGTCKNLRVAVTYENGEIATVSQEIDLKNVLPKLVQVGLSATTSLTGYEKHDIHSWSFTSVLETDRDSKNVSIASYA